MAQAGAAQRSLAEVGGKRRVVLLVARAGVVNAVDPEGAIVESALQGDPEGNKRHRLAHNAIADKLNKYMRKYKSLGAVERVTEADYIIFFNLLEYRRILYRPYPYGELYVIARGRAGAAAQAQVLWRSKKVQYAGDAARDLIKALRAARGEG